MLAARLARPTACLLIALTLAAVVAPTPASAIGIPPPPPPPGWSPVAQVSSGASTFPSAMSARADGSRATAVAYEYDSVMGGDNVTLYSRSLYGWNSYRLHTWLAGVNGFTVASTDQPDRAAVLGEAIIPAADMGAYVSFLPESGSPSAPELVSDTSSVQGMALAASPQGNVMALWLDYTGAYSLYANHSADGAGWDGAVPVALNLTYVRIFAVVPVGADSFIALWQNYDFAFYHVWASLFTASDGWQPPQEVVPQAQFMVGFSAAGSAASGTAAFATWVGDDLNATLLLAQYSAPGGWSSRTVDTLSGLGVNAVAPIVDVDGLGSARVLWGDQPELSSVANLTYGRAAPGHPVIEEWHQQVQTPDAMQIASASDGGAAVTWSEARAGGGRRAMVARYVPDSGWRGAEEIDIPYSPAHSLTGLHARLAEGGNYTAIWLNVEQGARLLCYRDFTAGNDPPVLTITAPVDGLVVETPTVLVEGTTAPGATVDVDGTAAALGADGTFSVRVAIENGTHGVVVTAVDLWGNRAQHTVTITYTDPAPGLEQDLAAAQADLASTQADLQAAHELTHTVQQQAGVQSARVENLSAQLNASNAVVQHQQSDLDFLKANSGGGSGSLLGILGIAFGLAGVAMSVVTMRRGGRPPQPPPESKPNPQPAGEAGAKPGDRAGEARGAAVGSDPAAAGVPLGGAGVGEAGGEAAKAAQAGEGPRK